MDSEPVYGFEELRLMRNAELKDILSGAKLRTSGTKAVLINRIIDNNVIRDRQLLERSLREKEQELHRVSDVQNQLICEVESLRASIQHNLDHEVPVHESSPAHQVLPHEDQISHNLMQSSVNSHHCSKLVESPISNHIVQRSSSNINHESYVITSRHQKKPVPTPRQSLNRIATSDCGPHHVQFKQPQFSEESFHHCSNSSDTTNALLENIAENIQANQFPIIEPPMFSGDIMEYQEWRKAFFNFIERKLSMSANDKLYYLQKYTCGEANLAVRGYCILKSNKAFADAIAALDSDYGSSFMAAQAFKMKLREWPKLGSRDNKGLKRLTDFLKQCRSAMIDIPQLSILSEPEENQKILNLFPDYIITKWNEKVTDYMMIHDESYPPFSRFVDFLDRMSRSANNPISSLQAVHSASYSNQRPSKPEPKPRIAHTHDTSASCTDSSSSSRRCLVCGSDDHSFVAQCTKFKSMDLAAKMKLVSDLKLCFRCLNSGHPIVKCKKSWYCRTCNSQRHNTLLHDSSKGSTQTSYGSKSNSNSQTKQPESHAKPPSTVIKESNCGYVHTQSESKLYAMTLPVWVSSPENPDKEVLTYAMLDNQSNYSYITHDLAAELKAKPDPIQAKLCMNTMTSRNEQLPPMNVYKHLNIRGYYNKEMFTLPELKSRSFIPYSADNIPVSEEILQIGHISKIAHLIAPRLTCEAGLLLGYECADLAAPLETIRREGRNCNAQRTVLGWCVCGPAHGIVSSHNDITDKIGISHCIISRPIPQAANISSSNNAILTVDKVAISLKTDVKDMSPMDLMKQISDADFTPSSSQQTMSQDDIKFLDILNDNTYQDHEGYYTMPLPFKQNPPNLPNNHMAVVKRFEYLRSRFTRDPSYKQEYCEFIQGIIDRGEAERVPDSELNTGECWYLPHHGVYHKQKHKLRVVFDCSAQYLGRSLNDMLFQGPDLNNPLLGVLLRFRQHPVAISCDIEKMYHRFKVVPEHRDYMRFLWFEGDDIVVYRMCVHIFGARSSPNCAKYGLNKLARDHGDDNVEAKRFIQSDFYVDDGLCSLANPSQAIELLDDTKSVCKQGNLNVHKILSNSDKVLEKSHATEQAKDSGSISLCNSTERALGVLWSLKSDSFKFSYQINDLPVTRRNMLSSLASVYDPMGLLSPLTLTGRILLQETCKSGNGWDERLCEMYSTRWSTWSNHMMQLSELEVPRYVNPVGFHVNKQELHTFADASQAGYGACSYLRSIDESNTIHCSLILGKSRVAPIKVTTIPRLELQAALLAARQHSMLQEELHLDGPSFLWSDSKIVLGYINNDEKRFMTYVSNRLSQIHEITCKSQWRYVNTKCNPADLASRGVSSVSDLVDSAWFRGPDFLWHSNPTELQDSNADQFNVAHDDREIKRVDVVNAISCNTQSDIMLNLCERVSSWTKCCRVMALVKKVIQYRRAVFQKQACNLYNKVSIDDVQAAALDIIKSAQSAYFKNELSSISNHKSVNKSSCLRKLDCYVDDGLLRVGGRMKHGNMLDKDKHPIILPRASHVSKLIIRYYHAKCAHQGRTTSMSAVRSAGFWIVGLSGLVSSIIYKCTICRRIRRPTEIQLMADLPADRVEAVAPFTNTGCDVFGPYTVQDRRTKLKRYGLVFTCLSSRAVHIEMLDDLTSDSFINSLRCFIALRGNITLLRCDNGTNFVGACNELHKSLTNMVCCPKVKEFLLKNQCEFKFNPPESSHFGGAWERMIRSIRNILAGLTVHINEKLDSASLRTLLYECMAIINSRPLTTVDSDVMSDMPPISSMVLKAIGLGFWASLN